MMMDNPPSPPAEDGSATTPRGRYAEQADDVLLGAIVGGDELALRELYERHARWIATRLRRTLPAYAVEDVLQETVLAV